MKKSGKKLCVALAIVVGVIVLVAAVAACVWGKELATLADVHPVEGNGYLYEVDYRASYDLDKLLAADVDGNVQLVNYVVGTLAKGLPIKVDVTKKKDEGATDVAAADGEHCTSFQARNADGKGWLYGRNYDFFKNPSLVLHSHPKDGYASVSVCDLSHLGYGLDKVPDSFGASLLCLAAVYAPMDGMNEKGLCTSIMALPRQAARQQTGKHVAGTSILMRLWLDRCATVQEALDLLATVDVRHDEAAGSGYHYMVADAEGHCAVVEFDLRDGWKALVTEKPDTCNFMHVTNHLVHPKYYTTEPDSVLGNPHSRSWWRYAQVADYMAAHASGALTPAEAVECLAGVHWKDLVWENGMVEDTQWSNVYDQQALTLTLHPWNDYDKAYHFGL